MLWPKWSRVVAATMAPVVTQTSGQGVDGAQMGVPSGL